MRLRPERLVGLGDHDRQPRDEPNDVRREKWKTPVPALPPFAADEQVVAEPAGFGIRPAQELGVELAVDVREQDAQQKAAFGRQPLCKDVGPVPQFGNRTVHPFECFWRDELGRVQNAADRGRGDHGRLGHVLHGRGTIHTSVTICSLA